MKLEAIPSYPITCHPRKEADNLLTVIFHKLLPYIKNKTIWNTAYGTLHEAEISYLLSEIVTKLVVQQ